MGLNARVAALLLAAAACHRQPPDKVEPARAQIAAPVASVSADALLNEARELRATDDAQAARLKLDAALVAAPRHPLASLERAELLVLAGSEAVLARQDAEAAVAQLPGNPRAFKVLGQTREEADDLPGALEAYANSAVLKPDPWVLRRVAALHGRTGDAARALRGWEAVRDAVPDDVGARSELARLYEEADRPASAEAEYRAAIDLAPQSVAMRRRFVELLEKQGKVREAKAQRSAADELAPPDRSRELRPLKPSGR